MGERKEKKPIKRICAGLLAHVLAKVTTFFGCRGCTAYPGKISRISDEIDNPP